MVNIFSIRIVKPVLAAGYAVSISCAVYAETEAEADAAGNGADDSFFNHNFSAEIQRYSETYQVDDVTVTFKPENRSYHYQLGIGTHWGLGISQFNASDDIAESLPAPDRPNRMAQVRAEQDAQSNSVTLSYYFSSAWTSLTYTQGVNEQYIGYLGPGKAFELDEKNDYTTWSLGVGTHHYVGNSLFGLQLYLDRQASEYESTLAQAEGTILLRNVTRQASNETSLGYVSRVAANMGYEFYGENWLLYPELGLSHTRTVSGRAEQFQQSSSRWVSGDRSATFNEEGTASSNVDSNPINSGYISLSGYWHSWHVSLRRQHTFSQDSDADVTSVSMSFGF